MLYTFLYVCYILKTLNVKKPKTKSKRQVVDKVANDGAEKKLKRREDEGIGQQRWKTKSRRW